MIKLDELFGGPLALTRTPAYRHAEVFATFSRNPEEDETIQVGGELYTFKASPETATQILLGVNASASAINATAVINLESVVLAAFPAGAGVLFVSKLSGVVGNDISVDVSGFSTGLLSLTGGSDTYNLTTPTAIGQPAIVTHSDGSKTEWGAVSLTAWLPRTAGIIQRANGDWYRQTLAADGTAQYDILLNQ